MNKMKKYLEKTDLLDFSNQSIQKLIAERGWKNLPKQEKVKQVYNFVRDEILFGYNEADDIKASTVLTNGYGQCNTKATLLMALLRAVGVPNRIHGFTINKALQKGAISGIWYTLSPNNILHSWVEVLIDDSWYFLEGVILDKPYLQALQSKFPSCKTTFCGYGVYTDNFKKPQIDWALNHTFIQEKGINQDFGTYSSPDIFYNKHQQQLGPIKSFFYRNLIRHLMNKNVKQIRNTSL